jgi:parallel beta-helix repeat protein
MSGIGSISRFNSKAISPNFMPGRPLGWLGPSNLDQTETMMSRTHTIAILLAAVLISALTTTQAYAVQRTHVSAAIGDDINTAANCTPVAPCRTFQAAMKVTDSNGEVVVLDSGDYGAVTITQSVALIAPKGVYGGISVFANANGVTIDKSGINVVLRGLTINGQGGDTGIFMSRNSKLTVENCVISNLLESGIFVTGAAVVRVTNTTIRDNGNGIALFDVAHGTITRSTISGNGNGGILLNRLDGGGKTTVDIADSTIDGNNGSGISGSSFQAGEVIKISVRDSRVTRNTDFGLVVSSVNGAAANLSASNNIVSNNSSGIGAFNASAKIWVSGNTVSDNIIVGLKNGGGTFSSAGNNAVRNNGTDTSGKIDSVGTK